MASGNIKRKGRGRKEKGKAKAEKGEERRNMSEGRKKEKKRILCLDLPGAQMALSSQNFF